MTNPSPATPLGWDDVYIMPTSDGSDTVYHRDLRVTYHSIHGAVGESKHVFMQAGVQTRISKDRIAILEFGFGTGLNAFLSYLMAIRLGKEISYAGIELFPLEPSIADRLNYPEYLAFPEEREIFQRMHRELSFQNGPFRFTRISSCQELALGMTFDCIFFDAFAPASQPELWNISVFERMYALTAPEGCLVTYCAQGEVRRNLQKTGYEIEKIQGPPGKREMLRAVKR